jgi:mevalonate pyrophosphate decarboxylase
MNKNELSDLGLNLSKELSKLADNFHVKSDARDILLYESATLEQEAKDLAENTGVKDHLKESTLLGQWGQSIHHQLPDISVIDRVKEFHEFYKHAKNT